MPSNKALNASRKAAFQSQAGRCCYCRAPTWLNDPSELSLSATSPGLVRLLKCTAEHAVPRKAGGADGTANIRAACFWCNSRRHRRKGELSETEYARLVQRRVAVGRWWPAHVVKVLRSSAVRPGT